MHWLACLLLAGSGLGRQEQELLKRVDAHYNRLGSLRTRYTETYAGMGMHRSENGTLTLKKPGRMLWQYDEPAGKMFVLDGKSAWFYTPGDPQAQRIPAKQMDDLRTPLRFLLGHTELAKELDGISVVPDGDAVRISGVPRGVQGRVAELSLRVVPGSGTILGMRVEEVDGAVTEFTFSGMEEGVKVGDGEFVFRVPKGVTVVSGTGPV